ncbi:uncharacterized protein SPSK_02952 [Sporothrix schenckii 1099-18]|uniref:Heme peroxidase n=1 Tax=Sporothrix schenckii 1099-18 TaxID=1397361 RepID=A0A0F2LZ24_SPOSC|nr:uncharacterized protein SPSK_02952 [Sporothrix schenckii 1099-18]KJR82079.1 hypothetical protein SPSK_02952 [Sporothrix schenckii 1099-18]
MHATLALLALALSSSTVTALDTRYHATQNKYGDFVADRRRPAHRDEKAGNHFSNWFHDIVKHGRAGDGLKDYFLGGQVPKNASFQTIQDSLNLTDRQSAGTQDPVHAPSKPHTGRGAPHHWDALEATQLFKHLGFELDETCITDKANWWYRTYDGSCNWLKAGEAGQGRYGQAKSRDFDQHYYADGIAAPREGPNARAVSNAFFRRNSTIYYEHTPLLLGLIEFIIHDVTWSQDSSTEFVDVAMPPDETEFAPNTTLRVWRAAAAPGTGTSPQNPRENMNHATTWIDVSSLYGSTRSVGEALRTKQGGRLKTQEVLGGTTWKAPESKKTSYLPFDTIGVPVRSPPGMDPASLFAGGDPRTNEDWVMLAVHSLLLREHNRLAGILADKRPDMDDEQLYQTTRLLMSAKFQLIGNSYQMAYFEKDMPWPQDDGFPLFREIHGEDWLQMNPANTYPWPLAMKAGRPTVVSAEMAVVYRFHEFIINEFPIVDAGGTTLHNQSLFDTGFDAKGFIGAGLENILRGVVSTTIPNFKSGVDESFRSAGKYRGSPFDIVTWSIVHEREQGLPTFNNYFRAYNAQKPDVPVPIRERFEDFTTNPEHLAALKTLYTSPDEVDLVVGCQLDETMFPATSVPKSSLIVSLFNLISMGNADRFSVGYAAMRCWLVDKPWDCHPSNALEDLLWKPVAKEGFPNFRFYDDFWMEELDFQAHGQNLLWRIVTENTDIKCLQQHPLFPADPKTNPVLCVQPPTKVNLAVVASTATEVTLSLVKAHYVSILATVLAVVASVYLVRYAKHREDGFPRVLYGWPVLGEGYAFQKDAKAVLLKGLQKLGSRAGPSNAFGMHLGPQTHYLLSQPADLQMMLDDNPYGVHFNLDKFFAGLGAPIFLGKDVFSINLHATLIRTHLGNPDTVRQFGPTIAAAAERYLRDNQLAPSDGRPVVHQTLSSWMDRFSTSVSARCMLGADADQHPELIDLFLKFNTTVDTVMQLSSVLPSFLSFIPQIQINRSYKEFSKIFLPIIQRRRADPASSQDGNGQGGLLDFMPFILEAVDDDHLASNLVAISVWIGLRNLQVSVTSTLLDLINEPGLADQVAASVKDASLDTLDTFSFAAKAANSKANGKTNGSASATSGGGTSGAPWALLRSAVLESIRLCGTITGPARIIAATKALPLRSDPAVRLPPGKVATLSTWYTHRQTASFGPDAAQYRADRFVDSSPAIGSVRNISFGLQGPRICPGQWYVQEAICIMVQHLLAGYTFTPSVTRLGDADKYIYHAGVVTRKEVPVTVTRKV